MNPNERHVLSIWARLFGIFVLLWLLSYFQIFDLMPQEWAHRWLPAMIGTAIVVNLARFARLVWKRREADRGSA